MIASQMARRLLLDLLGAGLLGIATLWLWLAPDQSQIGYVLASDGGGRCCPRFGVEWFKDAFPEATVDLPINYLPLLYWQPAPMETLLPQPWFRLPSILEDSLKKERPSASILPLRRFALLQVQRALRVDPESKQETWVNVPSWSLGKRFAFEPENGFLWTVWF